MASYIEIVLDFLEKQSEKENLPNALIEDIEWAIETISQNRLYAGNLNMTIYDEKIPEIKAWIQIINL